jgi:hypothetical protein
MEHYDYELISGELWKYLRAWYGLMQGNKEILRPCSVDERSGKLIVDLYFENRRETPFIDD